jgi:hypothetical protein
MNPSWVHTAGDTLSFRVDVTDFLSTDGWTLTYYLTPRFTTPVQARIELLASGNADGSYQVQEAAANTATWAPGAYGWQRRVAKAGVVQTLAGSENQGECLVRANPATLAQGYDGRSHARKMLDQVEAALEAFSMGVKAYTIGSRSMTKQDLPEILKLRDQYRAEVANEDAAAKVASGLPNPRNVGIRFNRI